MRLYPFALVLAATALAACNGDPSLLSTQKLLGTWRGEEQPYTTLIGGQVRTLQGHVELSLFPNGTYHREEVLYDAMQNRGFVDRAEEGTFSTRDVILDLKIHALYTRNGAEPRPTPPLQPFEGEGLFGYRVEGNELTVNWCPMGANCVRDFTTRHTRVTPELAD